MDDWTRMKLVSPYCLKMMRLNALRADGRFQRRVRRVGRKASTDDVIAMRRDPWRSSVVGAWFGLAGQDQSVASEVLRAFDRSTGSLDAPPLITSAVLLAGPDAMQ